MHNNKLFKWGVFYPITKNTKGGIRFNMSELEDFDVDDIEDDDDHDDSDLEDDDFDEDESDSDD